MKPDLLKFEKELWNSGIDYIAGIDEVGRGALAGPLVVATVILNKDHFEDIFLSTRNNDVVDLIIKTYSEINDSKLISAKKRQRLSEFIIKHAICYSIDAVEPYIIDNAGIMEATQIAYFNSIRKLETKPDHILSDTYDVKRITKENQTNIPKGDTLSLSIAAASIVAKVFRDNIMREYQERYGKYGFAQHKGYGTKAHREAISVYGPCDIHRRSFEPVKSYSK